MNKKNWFLSGLFGTLLILSLVFGCDLFQQQEPDPGTDPGTGTATAERPVITVEPTGRIYKQNDPADPLSVTATVSTGAPLSYQWYTNTTFSVEDGEIINGATDPVYAGVSTAQIGDTYYYVVVTHNDGANLPSARASSPAQIRVTTDGGIGTAAATITVNTDTKYQYVRGFGGMSNAWNTPALSDEDIDQLFSQDGFGFNILRVMIYPDMDALFDGREGAPASDPDAHKNYYNMVSRAKSRGAYILASPWTPPPALKNENTRQGCTKRAVIDKETGQQAIDKETGELLWEDDLKDIGNNRKVATYPTHVPRERWGSYAQHLKDYISRMADNNAAIDYISIQNEPDIGVNYDGCYWTAEEMRDFVKLHAREIAPADGPVKIIPGESYNFGQTDAANGKNTLYYNSIYDDPAALSAIDVIAGHIYGNGLLKHTRALDAKKEVWMTEHYFNTSSNYALDPRWDRVYPLVKEIHECMVNDFSAYVWWYLKRFYCMIGDGHIPETPDGQLLFRGYAMSHYAKYATGKTRVGATFARASGSTPANIGVTAYESDTEITLVLFNLNIPSYSNAHGQSQSASNATNIGQVHIKLPVAVTGASMVMTKGSRAAQIETGSQNEIIMAPQPIVLSPDKQTAVLDLPPGCIISVRFTK